MTTLESEQRRQRIHRRFVAHVVGRLRGALLSSCREAWRYPPAPGPQRYGWMPPVSIAGSDGLMFPVCPELIAETTQWLSDDELDVYVATILRFLDEFAAHAGVPSDVVYRAVESELYEWQRAELDLVSQVELRALDEGLATL